MKDLDNYNLENNILDDDLDYDLDDDLDENNSNIDGSWSKGNYAKTNNNKTSDIYERFINRVQNINTSNDKTITNNKVNSNSSSAYKPSNDDELQFVISPRQTLDIEESHDITSKNKENSIELSLDDSHTSDEDISEFETETKPEPKVDVETETETETETNIDSNIKQIEALKEKKEKKKGKQLNNSKLLIIGIISGLLLSALIVMLLNATGMLTTSGDSSASTSSQTTVISTSVPADSAEPSNNEEITVKADDISVVNSSLDELSLDDSTGRVAQVNATDETTTIDKPSASESTNNSESITAQGQGTQSTAVTTNSVAKDNAETAISYEDFAEEAQTTLYREPKN